MRYLMIICLAVCYGFNSSYASNKSGRQKPENTYFIESLDGFSSSTEQLSVLTKTLNPQTNTKVAKKEIMKPRINVITLGVKDLERSKKFYKDLGFVPSSISNEHLVAFQLEGCVFCLYPLQLLAEDVMMDIQGNGFRGITLAYNVSDKAEVKSVLKHAEQCGAKIQKPAQDVFWGGHSGYFTDPDGHLWEVAWNPYWPIGENGLLELPE